MLCSLGVGDTTTNFYKLESESDFFQQQAAKYLITIIQEKQQELSTIYYQTYKTSSCLAQTLSEENDRYHANDSETSFFLSLFWSFLSPGVQS